MSSGGGAASKVFTWEDVGCLREVAESIEVGFKADGQQVPRAWAAAIKRMRTIADRIEGRLRGGKTAKRFSRKRKLRSSAPDGLSQRRKAKHEKMIPREVEPKAKPAYRPRRQGDDHLYEDIEE